MVGVENVLPPPSPTVLTLLSLTMSYYVGAELFTEFNTECFFFQQSKLLLNCRTFKLKCVGKGGDNLTLSTCHLHPPSIDFKFWRFSPLSVDCGTSNAQKEIFVHRVASRLSLWSPKTKITQFWHATFHSH